MLKWIYDTFYDAGSPLSFIRVFQYITFRAAVSAVLGFALGVSLMPWAIRAGRRSAFRSVEKADVPFHSTKAGTPILGGAVVVLATLIGTLVCGNLANSYVQMMIVVLVGLGLVGFLDDYMKYARGEKGLYGRVKLALQLLVASIIVFWIFHSPAEYRKLWVGPEPIANMRMFLTVPFFKDAIIDLGWLYIPFAICTIVGASNAVNLTDGLDGLAGGLSIFAVACYGALAYIAGHFVYSGYLQVVNVKGAAELTAVLGAMVGALLGFLWYNAPPATIFLGDTGSLTIGGVLGAVALLIKQELLLILVGFVFVLETSSVMLQVASFKLTGKRIFRMSPLHHHFELQGWSESKIVIRFWIIGIISALMTLMTLKLR